MIYLFGDAEKESQKSSKRELTLVVEKTHLVKKHCQCSDYTIHFLYLHSISKGKRNLQMSDITIWGFGKLCLFICLV